MILVRMSHRPESPTVSVTALHAGDERGSRGLTAQEWLARKSFILLGLGGFVFFQLLGVGMKLAAGHRTGATVDALSVVAVLSLAFLVIRKNTGIWGYHLLLLLLNGSLVASHFIGGPDRFVALYSVPLVTFFLLGIRHGLLNMGGIALIVAGFHLAHGTLGISPPPQTFALHFLVSFGLLVLTTGVIETLRGRTLMALRDVNRHIRLATERLKTLGDLIPICSHCKRMKSEDGYWHNLGLFLAANTKAEVSFGLCDACAANGPEAADHSHRTHSPNQLLPLKSFHSTFILAAALFVGVTTVLFSLRDLHLGHTTKAVLQILLSVLIIGAALFHKRRPLRTITSHLVVAGIFSVLVLPYLGQQPEPMEILWFFLFPGLATYILGLRASLLWSVALFAFLLMILARAPFLSTLPYSMPCKVTLILGFPVLLYLYGLMEQLRARIEVRLRKRRRRLRKAYDEIRTLQGLVPVCSSCNAIRDDEGFWHQVERHLSRHTSIRLSHGICRECMEREYPEIWETMTQEERQRLARVAS